MNFKYLINLTTKILSVLFAAYFFLTGFLILLGETKPHIEIYELITSNTKMGLLFILLGVILFNNRNSGIDK